MHLRCPKDARSCSLRDRHGFVLALQPCVDRHVLWSPGRHVRPREYDSKQAAFIMTAFFQYYNGRKQYTLRFDFSHQKAATNTRRTGSPRGGHSSRNSIDTTIFFSFFPRPFARFALIIISAITGHRTRMDGITHSTHHLYWTGQDRTDGTTNYYRQDGRLSQNQGS